MSTRAQNMNWVETTLSSMTVEEKVGQLFIADLIAVYSHQESENFRLAKERVIKYHVGGFVLAGGTVSDIALMANVLQTLSRTPLLINADLEGGLWFLHPYRWVRGRAPELPRYVSGGGTVFPSAMGIGATGDPKHAYEFGRVTAHESRAVGIHWTNSPVADVNNNPKNPIINTRSFGENPAQVAAMVEAYVKGLQDGKMMATLKHFPGHGDTEEDTHMKLPVLPFNRERLEMVELVPFKAGIAAGAKAVMTAHLALPQLDQGNRPATLSPGILTGLLRKSLGFQGVVITDGMTMQGVTDHYTAGEAAVLAIEAGADVVLVPSDFREAYLGVLSAVQSERISMMRLEESVRRVLAAKSWVGLDRDRLVDLQGISMEVAAPESEALSTSAFEASVTLLRNKKNMVPLKPGMKVHVVTISDEPDRQIGEALRTVLQAHDSTAGLSRLSNDTGSEEIARVIKKLSSSDVVVVGVYLSVGSWKGPLGFSRQIRNFLTDLGSRTKPTALVTFGDPYVFAKLPSTDIMIAAYSGWRKSEEAVGKVLVGTIGTTGKLPVTIPGKFQAGEGIQLQPSGRAPEKPWH